MKLWQLVLIALKAALLVSGAVSGAQPAWDNNSAIVRSAGCSGVCVHPDGLILTAKHCIDDQEQIDFTFASGKVVAATKVHASSYGDGPVVFRANATGLPWIPVAGDRPRKMERVTAYGFVSAMPPVCVARGHLIGGDVSPIPGDGIPVNTVSFAGQPGCSGGPLLNARGEVIGLLLSTNGNVSFFCSWTSTRAAYDAGLASLGSRPEVVAKPAADAVAVVPDRELLTIATQPERCQPCRRFQRDYETDKAFRAAIDARFRIVLATDDNQIRSLNVDQIPTFIAKSRRVVGYAEVGGKEKLLRELGITAKSPVGSVWIGEASPFGESGPPPAGEVPPPPAEESSLPSVFDEQRPPLVPIPETHHAGLTTPPPPASASHTADAGPAPTIADKASRVIGVLGTGFTIAQLVMVAATGGVGALAVPLSRWAMTSVAGMVIGGVRRRRQHDPDAAKNSPGMTHEARAGPPVVVQHVARPVFAPYETQWHRDNYTQCVKEFVDSFAAANPSFVQAIQMFDAMLQQRWNAPRK